MARVSPAWSFGRVAPLLELSGFEPIPISLPDPRDPSLGKKPPGSLSQWQVPAQVASRLPTYQRCGTGILTATTPAVDIDVRHAELANAINRRVVALAGDAPVRFGQAPKRLRVYRTSQPFPKLANSGYRLPGDQPDDKPHRVEILGAGQQFVAYGIHAVTGCPTPGPTFISSISNGSTCLRSPPPLPVRSSPRPRPCWPGLARKPAAAPDPKPLAQHRPGPPPRPVQDLREARRVLATLRDIDPSPLDYDTWVAVAYGLKAAIGCHGYRPWMAWSGRSTKNVEATTERTWRSVKPQRCGWRYLERVHDRLTAGGLPGGGHHLG